MQWVVDTGGGALFVHQPYGTFDLTGLDGRFAAADPQPGSPPVAALPLDLFVVGAREPAAIMREYARMTGYPELPPLWAFGYQQSHRTLAGRDEILEEARTFREKKLPCDTMIYLGTGFCPSGWNTDNGEFTFNAKVFPDPKAVIQQLHDRAFQGGAARRARGQDADRHGRRSVHGAAAADRPHPGRANGPTIVR